MKLRLFFTGVLCVLSGCCSKCLEPRHFIDEISSADHIVATNGFVMIHGSMEFTNFSRTISGRRAKEIIDAISKLREPYDEDVGIISSATFYTWHLQFYRGSEFLDSAGLSGSLIECGVGEFHTSPVLKKLYKELEEESWGGE